MAAIARVESGFDPLTIHDNTTGTSEAPTTPPAAIAIATNLLAAGHSLDIGIMQINAANFLQFDLNLSTAFDACRSIAAAEAILSEDYAGGNTHAARQAALRIAISKYNTGDPARGFSNGYVRKVELSASRIIPALDVGVPPVPAPARADHAAVSPAARRSGASSWNVFPPDPVPSAPGGAAQGELTLSDAGREQAAAVVTYSTLPNSPSEVP